MPLKKGGSLIGWAKEHQPDEAQKLVDQYQLNIVRAVIQIGNAGMDPAVIGDMLVQAGKAVGHEGFKSLVDAVKDLDPLLEDTMDPEMAALGGNPKQFMLFEMDHMLQDMGRGLGRKPARTGIGFTADLTGLTSNGPKKPTDIN